VPSGRLNANVKRFEAVQIEPEEVLFRPRFSRDLQPHNGHFVLHLRAFDE
jgi:hypothetical protein